MEKLSKILMDLKKYSLTTYDHSIRVSNICMFLGRKLNLSEEEIKTLRLAGLLHDIGKLKVSKDILDKPAKLTKEEYDEMKNHSKYGVDLLINNGFNNNEVLNLILCHHERIDGLGYPNHLTGDKIPKLSKILTVCDCFDAMNSKRPYKEIQNTDYIRSEFINNSGTQFDPYYAKELLNSLNYLVKEIGPKKKI